MKIEQLLLLPCIFIIKTYSLEVHAIESTDRIDDEKRNIPAQRKCPEYHSCINDLDELKDVIMKLKIERASTFETIKMIIRTNKEKETQKSSLEKESERLNYKFNKLNNIIRPNELKIARNIIKIEEMTKYFEELTEMASSWRKHCQDKTSGLQLVNSSFGSYYFYDDRTKQKNWFEAQEICNAHGMNLLTVESQEEYDFVKDELESRIGTEVGYTMTSYWIGLNSLAEEGKFTYESTGYVPKSTYNAWLDQEPWTESGFYRCVDWHKSIDGLELGWSLEYCLDKFGFICKTSEFCHLIQIFDDTNDDIK